ncbi:class I (R) tRNA synthetase [Helicosporidium sp. ATCC 50920]|nr:class I (R) tRNA synthetase [Helicosporidium sp. ATCC 50920]|eukprot:KDD75315.1 class I (R) tRNA synthetase [Helicosporidium sp. ATCC 50920]
MATPISSVEKELARLFERAINTAFPSLPGTRALIAETKAAQADYQCNNAMALFGKLKGQAGAPANPRAAAQAILDALEPSPLIQGMALSGPGFINVLLDRGWLAEHVRGMLSAGIDQWRPVGYANKRVVVDFSSPNVAKEMHVGHLRSTIIGDCVSRCLEWSGADVLRLNHVGDWGTQFGMLIQYMSESSGGLEAAGKDDVSDLQVLYRASKQRFDEDEEFKTRAREAVTRLQSGDEECVAAWRQICAASRREFQAIYDRLGVTIEERGESFYNPRLQGVVDALKEQGVACESDGAMCVFVEGKEVPLIVQKSDGGFGYASTDMAAIHQRIHEEKADWLVYITDVGQEPHFALVFAAARMAGYMPEDRPLRIDHLGFGFVLGEDGKKFRTRSGDTVRLVELLDEARDRAARTIRERRPDMPEEEVAHAACAMGYGAVKYADLKNNRLSNYRFSFDAMLDMVGNTAVYLLYAHARIASIVRKSDKDVQELARTTTLELDADQERALALHLARFPDAVDKLLQELQPSRLTGYLYELSGLFNQFYTECQVLGSEREDSRLLLAEATAVVMRQCFQLLGITVLYRI